MTTWKQALCRGAVTGSLASLASMAALAWRGRRDAGSTMAALNAPSHWIFGELALRKNEPSWRFTGTGVAIHHFSALMWGVLYEKFIARGRRGTPLPQQVGEAVVSTAAAAVIDFALTPKRFTPGFEHRLSLRSLTIVYGAFAIGVAAGSFLNRR
jgi:hypothetical protein